MRAFLSVPPGNALQLELSLLLSKYQEDPDFRFVRWTKPDHIHLTLKFFGDISEGQCRNIAQELNVSLPQTPKFKLTLNRAGAFPDEKRARVLWVGIQDSNGLLDALYQNIDLVLTALGHEPDTRAFHPHFTLGRIKVKLTDEQFRQLQSLFEEKAFARVESFRVDRIEMLESKLNPSGPSYLQLYSFPLKETFAEIHD